MIRTNKNPLRLAQHQINRTQRTGVELTAPQRGALLKMVRDLEAEVGLSKFDAIYPVLGGTAAAHALELLAGRDMTWSGTVTHDANGAESDGTSGFGTLAFDYSLLPSNWHMGVYINSLGTVGAQMLGWQTSFGTTNTRSLLAGSSVHQVYNGRWGATNDRVSVGTDGDGMIVGVRNSNTDLRLYKAGTESGSYLSAQSATASTGNAQTMKLNGASGYCDSRVAFLCIGDNLNASEVSALSAIVEAFQVALSREA